jgi:2-(1,2-epoxy-1,2-dihydrophenyl)acetyl-CoA isomerase
MSDELLYDRDGAVAILTINRPEAANALTSDVRNQMVEHLAAINSNPSIRAVVITASGDRFFCAGGDLRAGKLPSWDERPSDAPELVPGMIARHNTTGAQRFTAAVIDCEKPVVAAVNGTAAGLGVHLVLACDLVVAADNAKFIELFVRRGLLPDGGGAYLLSRSVGLHRAKELAFLGDDIPVQRAYELGIVNRIVPQGELQTEARALAQRLATSPTVMLSWTKWLLNRAHESSRDEAFRDESVAMEIVRQSADSEEGVRAFVERRPVNFRGW